MAHEKNDSKLLELALTELAIPLKAFHAGRSYRLRHLLRPPAPADWFAYEAALQMAVEELPSEQDSGAPESDVSESDVSESDEPSYRLQMRSTDAALLLWDRLIRRVDGYGAATDWRDLIPLAHKEAAVRALTLVAPAAPDSAASPNGFFPLRAAEIPVVLEAAVAGRAYPQLVHRFRPPSVDEERAYRRLLAENLIVRGTRRPRTLIPSRLPALVRLYDQLILDVEGYALNGRPLASPQEIGRAMDAWHKRVAVQTLFGDLFADSPQVAQVGASPATRDERLPAVLSELPE